MTTPPAQVSAYVARTLIECGCLQTHSGEPFRLPSGWACPVYMDCRRLISFPEVRKRLVELGLEKLRASGLLERIDSIAGAESSGIALAAWLAEALNLPMQYVRKQTKGFGASRQVVGVLPAGSRVLLVDDVIAAGRSKLNFYNALKAAGATVAGAFVVFDYGTFPVAELLGPLGFEVQSLATWRDVLAAAREMDALSPGSLKELQDFVDDPLHWSAEHGGISAYQKPT